MQIKLIFRRKVLHLGTRKWPNHFQLKPKKLLAIIVIIIYYFLTTFYYYYYYYYYHYYYYFSTHFLDLLETFTA